MHLQNKVLGNVFLSTIPAFDGNSDGFIDDLELVSACILNKNHLRVCPSL
jgi:hypothetical protein